MTTSEHSVVIAGFLTDLAQRRRRLQLVRCLAVAAAAGGSALAIAATTDRLIVLDDGWRWAFAAGVWGIAAGAAWWGGLSLWLRGSDATSIAGLAEQRVPGLRDRLLAAHQLAGPGDGRDSPVLRAQLCAEVAAELRPLHVEVLLPLTLVRRGLIVAGIVVGAHAALSVLPGLQWPALVARIAVPWIGLDRVSTLRIRIVEPETTLSVVPAGDPVAVVAELSADPLEGAWIESGDLRIALDRRDDGRWAGQLPVGDQPMSFRLRAGDGLTAPRQLTPMPRPRATAITLTITPPAYSGQPVRTVETTKPAIEALAGSRVDIAVTADQQLSSAELRLDLDGGTSHVVLNAAAGRHLGSFTVERSGVARLRLVAERSGFASASGGDAEVRAIPDLVPTIVLRRPTGEQVAPGDELLWLEGEAEDDVGLATVATEVRSGSGEWRALASATPDHAGSWPLRQRLDLLALGAVPGDRIEARLVAIDRKGSRAESSTVAVTVADPGYPMTRLAAAEAFEALAVISAEATQRAPAATATGEAWAQASGDGRQEELAHDAALTALRRELANAGSTARARLANLSGGSAEDLILAGRAARHLADHAATGSRAGAVSRAAVSAASCTEFASCLAALSAAEAAGVALRDLRRLDHDQDDARLLAAAGGGERSRRRLAAAAAQAGQVGAMLTRIAARSPASTAAATALGARLAAARQDGAQARADGSFEGSYFTGRNFAERRLVRSDPQIRFSTEQVLLAPNLPWQDISVRWVGQIIAPTPGNWTFFTTSDDGVRMWLGDRLVIDNWTDHGTTENSVSIALDGTPVELRLEYYQGGGGAVINLDWQGPDGKRTPAIASGGGEQGAIMAFQQRLRDLHRELVPLSVTLLRNAADARRRLALLAGDEAAALTAPTATREAAAVIAARLTEHAALSEARADADAQAVADRAQAATVVDALPATANAATIAADVHTLDVGERAEQMVAALERAATAPTALDAAAELLHARPDAGSALERAAEGLLAAAAAGREPDQAAREALTAARRAADSERSTARTAVAAARKRLGDSAPALANRLDALAQEATTAAAALTGVTDPAAAMVEAHDLSEQIAEAQVALHRDANQHDGGDAADRQRARDADGAAALLAQPPPRTEELLRRAAAATDPQARSEAIAQAQKQQAALAADLALAAQHWRALAEGRDPAATRQELRRREAEAGVAAQLDAAAAERDRLATLAEAGREQALAGLSEALRQDVAMQRELTHLAEEATQTASRTAEAAAKQAAVTAAEAQRAAEVRAAQLKAAAVAAGAVAEQARTLAAAVREQAERSSAEHQARPELTAAAVDLERIASGTDQATAAQTATRAAKELETAAARIDATTAPLSETLRQRTAEAATRATQREAAQHDADAAKQTAQAAQAAAQAAQAARDAAAATAERATTAAAQAATDAAAKQAATQAAEAAVQARSQAEQAAQAANQANAQAASAAAQAAAAQAAAEQASQAKAAAEAAVAAQPSAAAARESARQASALAAAATTQAASAAEQHGQQQREEEALAAGQRAATALTSAAVEQASRAAKHNQRLAQATPQPSVSTPSHDAATSQALARALDRIDAGATPSEALAAARQALNQARAAARRDSREAGPQQDNSSSSAAPSGLSGRSTAPEATVDWGRLPKEMARELMEGNREAVPEEYRRQVDGYFRAIGEQAQEKR